MQPTFAANAVAVVDSDVLSYWRRSDSRGERYSNALLGYSLFVSFQTVAEQFRWAEERGWGAGRRLDHEQYLSQFGVLPYSVEVARSWARIMAETKRIGRPMQVGDGWIAACAVSAGVPLATNNRKDFMSVPGLTLISFS